MRFQRAHALLTSSVLISTLQFGFIVVANTVEKHHPSRLSEFTDVLCPYNTICREGGPRLQLPEDRIGCCTDCSCSDDCGLTEKCCFPSLDRHRHVDRSRQECVYIENNIPASVRHGYNMIVDSYPNGSGHQCGTAEVPCGEDDAATALGELYPVFSKKTGRIYKNIKCAKCHGLSEIDIVHWKAYLACETWLVADVSSFMHFLNNGSMDPGCYLVFLYPGPSSDTASEICFSKAVGECTTDDMDIPDGLNMTIGEIRAACESDFTSMTYTSGSHKNVFCQLCDGYDGLGVLTCKKRLLHEDEKSLFNARFTVVLDSHVHERKGVSQSDIGNVQKLACSLNVTNDCRPVYCPSGQVRLDNGHCGFPITHWNTQGISINLKLYPTHSIKVTDIRDADFESVLADETLSVPPWPKHWRVTLLMYTASSTVDGAMVDHFHVHLSNNRKKINVEKVLTSIKACIKENWIITLNGTAVPYRQAFSEYTKFDKFGDKRLPVVGAEERGSSNFSHHLIVPVFQELIVRSVPKQDKLSIIITKMFFCDQVLLKPVEYVYAVNEKLLLYKTTGKTFFPGEIATVYDNGLGYIPKLCLDDAGFALLVDSSTSQMVLLKPVEYVFAVNEKLLLYKTTGKTFFPGEIATVYDNGLGYIPKLCLDDAGFALLVYSSTSQMVINWPLLVIALLVLATLPP